MAIMFDSGVRTIAVFYFFVISFLKDTFVQRTLAVEGSITVKLVTSLNG